MKKLAYFLTIAPLTICPAEAHSWYPRQCCNNDDCHPVPCSELTNTRYGLSWKGVADFSEPMIMLSPDGACHVCGMWEHSASLPYLPLCVFVPKTTS
jgi:hypothetical protein